MVTQELEIGLFDALEAMFDAIASRDFEVLKSDETGQPVKCFPKNVVPNESLRLHYVLESLQEKCNDITCDIGLAGMDQDYIDGLADDEWPVNPIWFDIQKVSGEERMIYITSESLVSATPVLDHLHGSLERMKSHLKYSVGSALDVKGETHPLALLDSSQHDYADFWGTVELLYSYRHNKRFSHESEGEFLFLLNYAEHKDADRHYVLFPLQDYQSVFDFEVSFRHLDAQVNRFMSDDPFSGGPGSMQ